MNFYPLEKLDLKGQVVLVRLDLNCPLEEGKILDDTRIQASLPILEYLLARTDRVVMMSHLGRPEGEVCKELSLAPVGEALATHLKREVILIDSYAEEGVKQVLNELGHGLFLLENLRFHKEEKENNREFAAKIATGMDFYINDAFGACHRLHTSVVALASQFPEDKKTVGFLIQKEIKALDKIRLEAEFPFCVLLGGAKVADKIGIILSLLESCTDLLIGGAMAYTFLHFQGIDVGDCRVEYDCGKLVEKIIARAKERKVHLHFPEDHVCVPSSSKSEAELITTSSSQIPPHFLAYDIGPRTIHKFARVLARAKTILWNGPMGYYEKPTFAKGTLELAKEIAGSSAYCVVGGGDSAAAIKQAGVEDKISHVSTGGGASLEYLEGRSLPGLKALEMKR